MPNKYNKILKHNHRESSLEVPAIIFTDLECLLEKTHSYQNNLEKSLTEKKAKDALTGCSLFSSCLFDPTRNKRDFYSCKDCIEKFCKDLKKHAMRIVNYEKEEMILVTDKETESYTKAKSFSHMKRRI